MAAAINDTISAVICIMRDNSSSPMGASRTKLHEDSEGITNSYRHEASFTLNYEAMM